MKYWGTTNAGEPSNLGKRYHHVQAQASDIEKNAYALLIYAAKNDVTGGQGVMKYLVSQRNSLGGYSSTQVNTMWKMCFHSGLQF